MKTIGIDVKSKDGGQTVATVTQFDSLDEAISQLGKEHCLELINQLHKKHAMDQARSKLLYDEKLRYERQAVKMFQPDDWDRIGRGEVTPEQLVKKYAKQLKDKAEGTGPVAVVNSNEEPPF